MFAAVDLGLVRSYDLETGRVMASRIVGNPDTTELQELLTAPGVLLLRHATSITMLDNRTLDRLYEIAYPDLQCNISEDWLTVYATSTRLVVATAESEVSKPQNRIYVLNWDR